MLKYIILFCLIQSGICFKIPNEPAVAGCIIDIEAEDPEPLIVNATSLEILYPIPGGIYLQIDDEILISCPGSSLNNRSEVTVNATCLNGTVFTVNGENIDINELTCNSTVTETIRYTGNTCEPNGTEIEVGYDLGDNFIQQIRICFDVENSNALYSTYYITKYIGAREFGVASPEFKQDDFYNSNISVNTLYATDTQRATINRQLGLPENSTKYIKDRSVFVLTGGHLSPKDGYVYAAQQRATFHYVNAAPQWQRCNDFNWNEAEIDVRDYANKHGVDLLVYTGTYGVCTLPHEDTGEETPLYLYDSGEEKGIAVPKLYWKLVYEPITQAGVVLLGVNNPFITSEEGYVICTDVSSQLHWLTWGVNDFEGGYSYACEIDTFKKIVDYLPDFQVSGLLL